MLVWPLPRVIARSAKAGPKVSLDIDTSPVIELVVKLKPPDDEPRGKDSSCAPSSTFICRAERARLSPTRKCGSWTTGWLGCERLMVDSAMTRLTRPASGPCAAATAGTATQNSAADDSMRAGANGEHKKLLQGTGDRRVGSAPTTPGGSTRRPITLPDGKPNQVTFAVGVRPFLYNAGSRWRSPTRRTRGARRVPVAAIIARGHRQVHDRALHRERRDGRRVSRPRSRARSRRRDQVPARGLRQPGDAGALRA